MSPLLSSLTYAPSVLVARLGSHAGVFIDMRRASGPPPLLTRLTCECVVARAVEDFLLRDSYHGMLQARFTGEVYLLVKSACWGCCRGVLGPSRRARTEQRGALMDGRRCGARRAAGGLACTIRWLVAGTAIRCRRRPSQRVCVDLLGVAAAHSVGHDRPTTDCACLLSIRLY